MGCGSDNYVADGPTTTTHEEVASVPAPEPQKPAPEISGKPLQIAEKKDTQNTQKLTTEHMMLPQLSLHMHGGPSLDPNTYFVSDAYVLICAPQGHCIKITANSSAKVTLAAFTPRTFPLASATEILQHQAGEGSVVLEVESYSINGFVICVGTEGREVDLVLDGQGKPILSIMHVEPLP